MYEPRELKDMFGNELKVGDTVLKADGKSCYIRVRTVEDIVDGHLVLNGPTTACILFPERLVKIELEI